MLWWLLACGGTTLEGADPCVGSAGAVEYGPVSPDDVQIVVDAWAFTSIAWEESATEPESTLELAISLRPAEAFSASFSSGSCPATGTATAVPATVSGDISGGDVAFAGDGGVYAFGATASEMYFFWGSDFEPTLSEAWAEAATTVAAGEPPVIDEWSVSFLGSSLTAPEITVNGTGETADSIVSASFWYGYLQ